MSGGGGEEVLEVTAPLTTGSTLLATPTVQATGNPRTIGASDRCVDPHGGVILLSRMAGDARWPTPSSYHTVSRDARTPAPPQTERGVGRSTQPGRHPGHPCQDS